MKLIRNNALLNKPTYTELKKYTTTSSQKFYIFTESGYIKKRFRNQLIQIVVFLSDSCHL